MQAPKLFFTPLFYVMDKGRNRVLAVKSEDKYELKGRWLEFNNEDKDWHVYHASLNIQSFNEYPERWDRTQEASIAWSFAKHACLVPKLTEEQCNHQFQSGYYSY